MWRCFYILKPVVLKVAIFSTYVEVFPSLARLMPLCLHFLHVCGGVSSSLKIRIKAWKFSPRMWRCFLSYTLWTGEQTIFSTYVEVFLIQPCSTKDLVNFLHVCGGVSRADTGRGPYAPFSPRMWRCFLRQSLKRYWSEIFSTYVEVFLIDSSDIQ